MTRNGRLVYARGFGWADRDAQQPVQPGSLFRIASISKMFTSAAILQLCQEGKTRLTDHPFRELDLPAVLQDGKKPDPRLKEITVLELLQHRGGFDRGMSFDPMFRSVDFAKMCHHTPPAMQDDIIRVMEGMPLDFDPGTRYAYSNFGYCVLGRLIEKKSGQSYFGYLKQNVLEPLGIHRMQLGRSLLEDRAPMRSGITQPKANPRHRSLGRWGKPYLSSMAAGASKRWTRTADGSRRRRTLFASRRRWTNPTIAKSSQPRASQRSSSARRTWPDRKTTSRSPFGMGAAGKCGMSATGRSTPGTPGCSSGTSTLLVRRSDGLDWAVLFNQDTDDKGKNLAGTIDPLVHGAADAVHDWPQGLDPAAVWP